MPLIHFSTQQQNSYQDDCLDPFQRLTTNPKNGNRKSEVRSRIPLTRRNAPGTVPHARPRQRQK